MNGLHGPSVLGLRPLQRGPTLLLFGQSLFLKLFGG
ncbi:hypothetical protein Q31a_62950 [Aureliella helgolandensis]|uniref:Uncharacterized protein n=1 Tax=Aureliella helgolandensis TaxID=2527968 RepID=A0A518GH34_9BACT|nr:hypothetical protein Q31a_62950 [Aureliella helgolandensis]